MTATDSSSTSRYIVLLEDDSNVIGARELTRLAGIRTANTADAAGASAAELFRAADGVVLHNLGIAVVTAGSEQASALSAAVPETGPIAAFEPDRTVYAIGDTAVSGTPKDDGEFTWGLRAVGADRTTATGAGVRVAVLDTGLDVDHPDFKGRDVVTASFIPGRDAHDGHGHGTHVIGTSCGPRDPQTGPGYGIASDAIIYAGKVLDDEGSGSDGGILAGIQWAIANGCAIVSMSLGAATEPGQAYSQAFEQVARRAMGQGTLIIAAAGNGSQRGAGLIAPVGHPANCPSIMAIGAIDMHQTTADFSSGTVDQIGQIDVMGPGVGVYSSWPGPDRYRELSGTSMATPHAAGVAALMAERHQAREWRLWARMSQDGHRLPMPSTDVGAGLVQAPE